MQCSCLTTGWRHAPTKTASCTGKWKTWSAPTSKTAHADNSLQNSDWVRLTQENLSITALPCRINCKKRHFICLKSRYSALLHHFPSVLKPEGCADASGKPLLNSVIFRHGESNAPSHSLLASCITMRVFKWKTAAALINAAA